MSLAGQTSGGRHGHYDNSCVGTTSIFARSVSKTRGKTRPPAECNSHICCTNESAASLTVIFVALMNRMLPSDMALANGTWKIVLNHVIIHRPIKKQERH